MKYLLLIAMLFIIGCATTDVEEKPNISETSYNGHEYLIFRVVDYHGQTFVHNPDCKCKD